MQPAVFLVVIAVAVGASADDCKPEKDDAQAWECCKSKGVAPAELFENVNKCVDKHPMPAKPKGPPSASLMKEVERAVECSAECMFAEAGMLTADKKLDQPATEKVFKGLGHGDKEHEAVITAALDKCFASYQAQVDASAQCKSGAMQLENCLMREGFLNCPRTMWTSSDQCGKLKAKVAKCPRMPVMLMPPPPAR